MLVAVIVLPAVAARWMGRETLTDPYESLWQRTTRHVIRWTSTSRQRWTVITLMMSLPALATWALLPKMDYLPDVKRDAVDVWMNFTPGVNLKAQREEVIDTLIARLAPYMKGEKEPALKNYYILRYPGGAQIGVRPKDETRIKELENLLMKQLLVGIPDTRVFGGQGSLFGGFDSENGVSLLLQGATCPSSIRRPEPAWGSSARTCREHRSGPNRVSTSPPPSSNWCRKIGVSPKWVGIARPCPPSSRPLATACGLASISTAKIGSTSC